MCFPRLHPLLHSPQWDTRMAAVEALEEVLSSKDKEEEEEIKKEEEDEDIKEEEMEEAPSNEDGLLTFETFDLKKVLAEGEGLAAARTQEEDSAAAAEQDVEKQREELNKSLGLDVAAKLGVKTDDIFSNDDLTAGKKPVNRSNGASPDNSTVASASAGLSARERNRLKRTLAKQKSAAAAEAKRRRCAPKLYKAPQEAKDDSSPPEEGESGWPLQGFCSHLMSDLFEKRWEVRHGGASALREVVRLRGAGAGRRSGRRGNEGIVENYQK